MNIALVGYGRMGQVVEEVAATQGVGCVAHFDRSRPLAADGSARQALQDVAVLIDFSVPDAVAGTVRAAGELGIPLVIGTTGWHAQLDDVRAAVLASRAGVVHGANFSLGVNVFYRLAEQAARLLAGFDGYDPFIQDWHPRTKRDAPSGTALEVQRRMARHLGQREVPITCTRSGYVPSEHRVGFDSEADTLVIEHRARNRRGLAAGALLAARWIAGRSGFYDFQDVMADVLPGDGTPG